jgi:excisionase family DNA binding protein
MPDEQLVAVARLRYEGILPDTQLPADPGKSNTATPRLETKPLMAVPEVAALLNTTEAAVYAMKARKKLPGVTKVGRRVLFRRDALLRWLAEGEPHR